MLLTESSPSRLAATRLYVFAVCDISPWAGLHKEAYVRTGGEKTKFFSPIMCQIFKAMGLLQRAFGGKELHYKSIPTLVLILPISATFMYANTPFFVLFVLKFPG